MHADGASHACVRMQQRRQARSAPRLPKTENREFLPRFVLVTQFVQHAWECHLHFYYRARSTYTRTHSMQETCLPSIYILAGYTRLLAPSVDPRLPRTYVRTACGIESVKLTAQRNEFEGRPTAYHSWPLSSHFCLHGGIAAFVHDFVYCDMLQRF